MRFTIVLLCAKKPAKDSILNKIAPLTKKYANLPDSYIERSSQPIEYKTPELIQYQNRTVRKPAHKYVFNTERPWTEGFQNYNDRWVNPPEKHTLVQPIRHWMIFKGDRVEVLTGRDRGKQGLVSQVIQERNWVIVAGLNWQYRIIGKTKDSPGMYIKQEMPLLVTTQVSLVDPSDNKPTKAEWRYTEEGEKVRVCLRTGRVLPMPAASEETYDYKSKRTYLENPTKDTKAVAVETITFNPKLKTFEMEIMDELGIKEDKIPKKTYWY